MTQLKSLIRLFVAVSIAGAIVTIMVAHWITPNIPVYHQLAASNIEEPIRSRGFLVDTPSCRIPNLDPFDSSITKFIRLRGKILCYGKPSITYEDGHLLKINWTTVRDFYEGDFKYCKYQPIMRSENNSDFTFTYGAFRAAFSKDTPLSDEFVRVYCVSKSEGTIYTNFHSLIIPKMATEDRCDRDFKRHSSQHKPKEVMNVLLIGIDSVSRLNFMRQMSTTRRYLLEELRGIEMLGYNKVADNTFVNIVPMTTGKFVEELPWNETMNKLPFDDFNFIWKNFSDNGYRTLYAEDAPKIAIFTFHKKGFSKPPADHYNRVFSFALEKHKSVWNHDHNCVGDRLETDIVLKYVRDFAALYKNKPYFGFAFITRLSHDGINDAGAADDPHFRFLKRMKNESLLAKTILVYYSDHGNRYGDIRNTFVGKLEERLPFLIFVFPEWFKKRYPDLITNMQINSRRLSSPFDVYETLKDILHFSGDVKSTRTRDRGTSLFREIPRDRTCDEAAILPHWCMCLNRERLPIASTHYQPVAEFIMNSINTQLMYHRHACETLVLLKVTEATQMGANQKVLRFQESLNDVINRTVYYGNRTDAVLIFQLTLIASPGWGMFEGTVGYEEATRSYFMAGDISRINKYGEQSDCIDNFNLKKYCFCKNKS